MAASASDYFMKTGMSTATTMSAPGYTTGNTTINVASTTNYPSDTGFMIGVDEVDSSGERVAGTYNIFRCIVASATQFSGVTYVGGDANRNYSAGATTRVYLLVSHARENRLVDGLLVEHSQTGGHTSISVSGNIDVNDSSTAVRDSSDNELLKFAKTASAVNELTVTNAATTTPPKLSASGGDTNINLLLDGKGTGGVIPKLHAPQGFLINGKISASVASNDLTLAIKTLGGSDPSANDPVYCNIDGTIRTITSALSVTKNDGTNWMNLGSAEHATQDVDLFAYLGYNATDGVVVGFSRIPYARIYSDFSTTSTNEKYCAISTITNAASTDSYVVIGRFNATLSASASYNWSIPATAVVVQRPIYTTRWLTYAPTIVGWTTPTKDYVKYCLTENNTTLAIALSGTSNSTSTTLTPPISPNSVYHEVSTGLTVNNGGIDIAPGRVYFSSTSQIDSVRLGGSAAWTGSGSKTCRFVMTYGVA